jgi:hypothetical protein
VKIDKISKYGLYAIIVMGLIALGYFRDVFLTRYNNFLYYYFHHALRQEDLDNFGFLKSYTYMQLYYAKFFIVAAFSLIYFCISYFTIVFIFKEKNAGKLCFVFYLLILFIAAIFYAIGILAGGNEKVYLIARTLLSLLQSPLILMLLIPAIKLNIPLKNKK